MNRLPHALGIVTIAALQSSIALAYEPPPATPPAATGEAAPVGPAAAAAPAAPPDAPVVPVKPPPDPEHTVAVTISPFHLFLPMVELTGEIKIVPKFSAAVILGYGRTSLAPTYPNVKLTLLEAGGQLLFYPVGDFEHGMQLGAELLFASVSGGGDVGSIKVVADAKAIGVGPLIGYKYTHKVGFALNLQGGVGYNTAIATAAASAGTQTASASAAKDGVYPIVNINFGWAF
jgi:hypothetical protein